MPVWERIAIFLAVTGFFWKGLTVHVVHRNVSLKVFKRPGVASETLEILRLRPSGSICIAALTNLPQASLPDRSSNMATRQRLLLYQLYLSLAATVYALCYPPQRLEEHLRALETLDNMALFYSVLGCYTFSVFLLVYWGVIPLAASFVTRVFGALFWTLGACDKGLQYLKVRCPQYNPSELHTVLTCYHHTVCHCWIPSSAVPRSGTGLKDCSLG